MKIVAVAGQKGGGGKTTIAVHVAVEAQNRGLAVAVIDADPQGSARSWADQREAETVPVARVGVAEIDQALAAAKQDGYDLVVIDTPPHATLQLQHVIALADLIVIPVQPSVLDLAALPAVLDLVTPSKTPHVAVISAAPVGVSEVKQIRATLEAMGLRVFETIIHQRMPFRRALAQGQAVAEFEPQGKAAAEIAGLWQEIAVMIQEPAHV